MFFVSDDEPSVSLEQLSKIIESECTCIVYRPKIQVDSPAEKATLNQFQCKPKQKQNKILFKSGKGKQNRIQFVSTKEKQLIS